MKPLTKILTVVLCCLAFCKCAHAQMRSQSDCTNQVKKDMEATRAQKPEVYATIRDYTFEWSRSHQACVMIIQYRTKKNGASMVQILATNSITMQPMEGTKNVFLVPEGNEKEIDDAANFLLEKYSR
jgi:hypothetical protein